MLAEEWPLIVFTLLTQFSAGIFFFSGIFYLTNKEKNNGNGHELKLSFISGVLGLFFAFFHLGTPLHAVNALNNLSSSWMSREILLVSVFLFLLFLLLINKYNRIKLNKILKNTLIITNLAVIIALTYSMIHIYYLPSIASWDNYITWYEFMSCTLIFGALVFIAMEKRTLSNFSKRITGILLIILFLLNIVVSYNNEYIPLIPAITEIVLNTIALVFSFTIVFTSLKKRGLKALMIWLLIVAIASETLGRFVFYLGFESAGI